MSESPRRPVRRGQADRLAGVERGRRRRCRGRCGWRSGSGRAGPRSSVRWRKSQASQAHQDVGQRVPEHDGLGLGLDQSADVKLQQPAPSQLCIGALDRRAAFAVERLALVAGHQAPPVEPGRSDIRRCGLRSEGLHPLRSRRRRSSAIAQTSAADVHRTPRSQASYLPVSGRS